MDAATRESQHTRLSIETELRRGINHFHALDDTPTLPGAPDKNRYPASAF